MTRTVGDDKQDANAAPTHIPGTRSEQPGHVLSAMQRTAGNRAVSGLVGHAASLQRDGETRSPAPIGSATALTRAETIRGNASARLLNIAGFNEIADRALGNFRSKQLTFTRNWGAAWDRHASVLAAGGKQAARENMIEGVLIGVAASVVVAAAAAAIPAVAAVGEAAAFTATWWGFQTASGAASSLLGTGGALLIGRPDVPGAAGGSQDGAAEAWRAVAQVEAATRTIAVLAPRFGLELGNAEYTIAQVQAHIDGRGADMDWDQTLSLASTLSGWETQLGPFDAQVTAAVTGMRAFDNAVLTWTPPDTDTLERQIWDNWMAGLNTETDEAIDQDAIQEHLVALGLIHDYFYMSDADQHREVARAQGRVAARAASAAQSAPALAQ